MQHFFAYIRDVVFVLHFFSIVMCLSPYCHTVKKFPSFYYEGCNTFFAYIRHVVFMLLRFFSIVICLSLCHVTM
jgi:hypothetical protein